MQKLFDILSWPISKEYHWVQAITNYIYIWIWHIIGVSDTTECFMHMFRCSCPHILKIIARNINYLSIHQFNKSMKLQHTLVWNFTNPVELQDNILSDFDKLGCIQFRPLMFRPVNNNYIPFISQAKRGKQLDDNVRAQFECGKYSWIPAGLSPSMVSSQLFNNFRLLSWTMFIFELSTD